MATIRTALRTLLENDAALGALLTGGVFDASELPQDGGGMSSAPKEANGVTIRPYAIIRFAASSAGEAWEHAELRTMVEIYAYQSVGYATIESALARIQLLLHDKYITADDRQIAHFLLVFESRDLMADEIGSAAMRFARYSMASIR
jgi:hypothetical protein